jgi:hypothetical protein
MKVLALAPVLALAAFTLAAAPVAEAAHGHGRDGGRRGYGYSHNWDRRPIVGYRHYDRGWNYRHGYASRYYGTYGYRYDAPVLYYDSGYYGYVPPPPPRPFCHRRHRAHVGVFLGF